MLSNRMFCSEKCLISVLNRGFPVSSDNKESTCNARDLGLIPGSEDSPGEWHGHSLQYSYLENPHGQRSLAGYTPCGQKESDTTKQLSTYTLSSMIATDHM